MTTVDHVAVPPSDFAGYYATGYPRLAAQLYAYLGDATEAEDLAQEAYLRAWRAWSKISEYDDPVGWVRHVAWNLATSRLRQLATATRLAARTAVPESAAVAALGPERVAATAVGLTLVVSAPAEGRQLKVLFWDGTTTSPGTAPTDWRVAASPADSVPGDHGQNSRARMTMASTASRFVRPFSGARDRHVQNETAWATTARSRRREAGVTSKGSTSRAQKSASRWLIACWRVNGIEALSR